MCSLRIKWIPVTLLRTRWLPISFFVLSAGKLRSQTGGLGFGSGRLRIRLITAFVFILSWVSYGRVSLLIFSLILSCCSCIFMSIHKSVLLRGTGAVTAEYRLACTASKDVSLFAWYMTAHRLTSALTVHSSTKRFMTSNTQTRSALEHSLPETVVLPWRDKAPNMRTSLETLACVMRSRARLRTNKAEQNPGS